jgi:ABC-type transport system involved in multi-copper enzyme maturation permease subunit
MSHIFGAVSLIAVALLGTSCFATGMLFSMNELLIVGIISLIVFIIGIGIFMYCFPKQTQQTVQGNPVQRYTTNNMNSMKRNKSDTDLELISKQGDTQDLA